MKFHCKVSTTGPGGKVLPPFRFTAYEYDGQKIGDVAPLSALERRVGPGYVEREVREEVEVHGADGTRRTEQRRRLVRERTSRLSLGRAVMREVLEVEADSPADAEAVFRRAIGIRADGTSRRIEAAVAEEPASAGVAPAQGGRRRKAPTADEAARALLGGQVPIEE
ncbi:MAG: hypothetical protein KIT58_03115 [Planctomycetota bacterium]|nr:hypothetical protein [Planctomycetota bacterium]